MVIQCNWVTLAAAAAHLLAAFTMAKGQMPLCFPVSPIENGTVTYIPDTRPGFLYPGTVATYSCDTEFVLDLSVGNETRTCVSNGGMGSFTGQAPVCVPVTTTPTTTTNPCASFTCPAHSVCRVFTLTGEPYCELSCDLNNGGCSTGTHCILRPNPECSQPPCPQRRSCCPHPLCDEGLCGARQTRRALCTNPQGLGCSGDSDCPLTFCHTCYFSSANNLLPGNCGGSCTDYSTANRCSRRWATCVRRAHHSTYGQAWPRIRDRVGDGFRCYHPPCPQS